jgi:hypothetical protein
MWLLKPAPTAPLSLSTARGGCAPAGWHASAARLSRPGSFLERVARAAVTVPQVKSGDS